MGQIPFGGQDADIGVFLLFPWRSADIEITSNSLKGASSYTDVSLFFFFLGGIWTLTFFYLKG